MIFSLKSGTTDGVIRVGKVGIILLVASAQYFNLKSFVS
jgi:hypothetical protein